MNYRYPTELLGMLIAPVILSACTGWQESSKDTLLLEQTSQPQLTKTFSKQQPHWPEPTQLKKLPNHGTSKLMLSKIQNIKAAKAFLHNYRKHLPGQWHWIVKTIEGDPIDYRFYYMGQGESVYIESDTRQDKFSSHREVTREICDRLGSIKLDKGFVSWEGCRKIPLKRSKQNQSRQNTQ